MNIMQQAEQRATAATDSFPSWVPEAATNARSPTEAAEDETVSEPPEHETDAQFKIDEKLALHRSQFLKGSSFEDIDFLVQKKPKAAEDGKTKKPQKYGALGDSDDEDITYSANILTKNDRK